MADSERGGLFGGLGSGLGFNWIWIVVIILVVILFIPGIFDDNGGYYKN